jgi:hypothetical protein
VIRPIQDNAANLERLLQDPELPNLYFDISWSEVAKYIVARPEATRITAAMMERHAGRFLFGADEVAPTTEADYMKVFEMYRPLWNSLTPQISEKVRKSNYERIFTKRVERSGPGKRVG